MGEVGTGRQPGEGGKEGWMGRVGRIEERDKNRVRDGGS